MVKIVQMLKKEVKSDLRNDTTNKFRNTRNMTTDARILYSQKNLYLH